MIFSVNTDPDLADFGKLVEASKDALNLDAKQRKSYYKYRTAQKLETDVFNVMNEVAQGTNFEKSIMLVSGHKFPDIVAAINANKYYGVEVKSTSQNHWESFGNSVLESSRCDHVKRIFIMFGKLADPIEFKARPYEECLSEVTVTHYPRYHINMDLEPGKTIFDKINKSYDEVRSLTNPVAPFAEYYRRRLKPGESLWWLNNNPDDESGEQNIKIRLWNTLSQEDKEKIIIQAMVYFPETITLKGPKKYINFTLWLVAAHGVVSTSARDSFSAGGKCDLHVNGNIYKNLPRVFGHICDWRMKILNVLRSTDQIFLTEKWERKVHRENLLQDWIKMVSQYDNSLGKKYVEKILWDIFHHNLNK